MDFEARIARTEAIMETNRQDIDRLHQSIAELRTLLLERTDNLRAELVAHRDHLENRFSEQRKYIDDSLKDLRLKMEDGFKEVRREASTNQRWMIGLTLVNTSMVLSLGGRIFGLY